MRSVKTVSLSLIWAATILVLLACNSDSSQQKQSPSTTVASSGDTTAPEGASLRETRCSVCHGAKKAKGAKKTRDQWDQTVTRMIGKGAKLTEAEKKILVDYLAETYKP